MQENKGRGLMTSLRRNKEETNLFLWVRLPGKTANVFRVLSPVISEGVLLLVGRDLWIDGCGQPLCVCVCFIHAQLPILCKQGKEEPIWAERRRSHIPNHDAKHKREKGGRREGEGERERRRERERRAIRRDLLVCWFRGEGRGDE